ncbi:hypothetical protein [Mycobacteroides abscessus]|uniref:hypothetical protein n=1 Tax=Mycobacteroides abscessus TaxID=36809 RepID=UPI0009295FDE|nr:hypothetical protein [Mycobacteroides abscessus]MBN7379362.1 hypothetical protein [Mycobacteroides abscessus subsp. massiliense]MDO2972703.1 hypothetical protein [Mycobacteroides abscessus subsp. bolletii]MDO3081024.1 hypothetical protein [Mycobacteroides abscessus subsp. bolletii]SIK16081.1 Uncharacterised protein [Mycobacteroides abscessus subsp. abscessus]SIL54470.1 Uncharacterised protein [Mycobacteroides abscessus subsp. abscessus]
MKTIGKAVVGSMLLLVVVAVLIYQLLASIPTWLWLLAVAYLLYRNRQLLRSGPGSRKGARGRRGGRAGHGWPAEPGGIAPPPVVYVMQPPVASPAAEPAPAPPVAAQRAIANAPEPWKFT